MQLWEIMRSSLVLQLSKTIISNDKSDSEEQGPRKRTENEKNINRMVQTYFRRDGKEVGPFKLMSQTTLDDFKNFLVSLL